MEEYKAGEKLPVKVVLDNIRSLHNVGSVFRTCDAFGVEELVLCGITGTPPHREILKTALGATESVKWSHFKDVLASVEALMCDGYTIVSVEQCEGSVPLGQWQWGSETRLALVFGNEVSGVAQEVIDASDLTLEIPQVGIKHSLNVAVSAGIVLWEVFRKKMG